MKQPDLDGYIKTTELRWLAVNTKNPGGPPEYRVLQQRWRSIFSGEQDQWRVVPLVAEEDTK